MPTNNQKKWRIANNNEWEDNIPDPEMRKEEITQCFAFIREDGEFNCIDKDLLKQIISSISFKQEIKKLWEV